MGVSMRSAKLVTLLALLSFACLRLSTITGFQQQNHLLQRQSVMARYLTLKYGNYALGPTLVSV